MQGKSHSLRCRWLWGCASALIALNVLAQSNPFPTSLDGDVSKNKFASVANYVQPLVDAGGSSWFDPFVPYPTSAPGSKLFPDLPTPSADTVVRFNACGRELDYALFRNLLSNASLADKDRYGNEGSELTSMVLAKIIWLNNKATASMPCDATMTLRPDAPPVPLPPASPFAYRPPSFAAAVSQLIQLSSTPACTPAHVSTGDPPAGRPLSPDQPQGVQRIIVVEVTPACMREQVNDAINAMKKVGNLGTSGIPCGLEPLPLIGGVLTGDPNVQTDGDWDPNNRELVRILYLGTQTAQRSTQFTHPAVLDIATLHHMEVDGLLAAAGPVGPDWYPLPLPSCSNYAGDQQGGAADIENQGEFGNTLAHDLGNDLEWLIDLIIKIEIGGELGVLDSALPLVLTPYLIATEAEPALGIFPTPSVPYTETENHRIQIETSRFLTNAYYLNELAADGRDTDSLLADQQGVTAWLQGRMQSIALGGFIEYNAKNYGTYSLQSLVNLYDFADDPSLQIGAHALLDLTEAKFASGSSLGRRIVPFRRHSYEDGYSPTDDSNTCGDQPYLYHSDCSEDQEMLRSLSLVGQTQLMPKRFPNSYCPTTDNQRCIDSKAMPSLLNTDISPYTLPDILRDVVIQRPGPLSQHVHQNGIESYYQEHSFTVSEGGIQTPGPYPILGLNGDSSARGDAMPAVIIPTMEGITVADVFSFDGIGVGGDRTNNLCMYKGFICGLNPNLPDTLRYCTQTQANGAFVTDTTQCKNIGSDQMIVVGLTLPCQSSFCAGAVYGFMEAIDCSPKPSFGTATPANTCTPMIDDRLRAVHAVTIDTNGQGTYVNHFGEKIHFAISPGGPVILTVDGNALPDPAVAGDIINLDGAGHAVIHSPFSSSQIRIDYSNATLPAWTFVP